MTTEIRVPTLGESVTEATIAQWFKKEGDKVEVDEPLVELETDKVSVEVPAPEAGVISEILAGAGDTVEVGALLGNIKQGAVASPAATAPKAVAEQKSAAPAAGGEIIDIVVPSSGESVTEAEVGEWFKQEGDKVDADEPIVSLETDKASMDIGAPSSGVLHSISAKAGETVEVGAVLGQIAVGSAAAAPQPAAAKSAPAAAKPESNGGGNGYASPSSAQLSPAVQRVVAENDLDPAQIRGTGKGGRITKADALAYLEQRSEAPAPQPQAKAPRELGSGEERVPMTRLRRTIAARLKEAQNTAAMLTTFNEVDMTTIMSVRKQYKDLFEKKHGVKLGFMGFFVKACVHALQELPAVNAEIEGGDIIYKNYYHVGVAVGTDKGLVVPVLRDVDTLSVAGIEKTINGYAQKARSGDLKLEDMQGGTFTISNGGVYGSLMSTPILNTPQSGILGMHKIQERPMAIDGRVEVRPMMYLALSYDHRIVDGKEAVTFLVRVKDNLEDPQRLFLDL